MGIQIAMLIVWAVVIAVCIVVEFLTCRIISISFVPGAIIALLLAAFNLAVWIQVPVFFVLAIIGFFVSRPIFRRYLQKAETASFSVKNKNIGKRFRLVSEVVDGKASIIISDIMWSCIIENDEDAKKLTKDDYIEIVDFDGNKPVVKAV